MSLTFTLYEPFAEPVCGDRRHFVIYVHSPDGSRYRAGSADVPEEDAAGFLEFWAAAGGGLTTAEDLGLPGRIERVAGTFKES